MSRHTPCLARLLLRLYPRWYRERYGEEVASFIGREREEGAGGARYWLGLITDHVHAAAVLRRRRGDGMMRSFVRDLMAGARALRRAGAFTAFAVVTLALGIGATTAVFSVVDRVVLRPLPYPDSERMVLVGIRPRNDPESRGPLSDPLALALGEAPGPAEAVVAAGGGQVVLRAEGDPERVSTTRISEGFFEFFGAEARVGRLLGDADHQAGAPRTAVLGHGFWSERYGRDPGVVGSTVHLDDEPYTIVGVLAPDFVAPPEVTDDDRIWISLGLRDREPQRGSFHMVGVARLRPGATAAEMTAYMDQVVEDVYPPGDGPNFLAGGLATDYRDEVVGPIAGRLGRVLGAVGLLLLIACVNVASLLLTRGTERAHELSVRRALGAGRSRLVRQLLAESTVLAVAGGALGSALAFGAVELFRQHAPPGLPRLAEVAVDGRGLAFALVLAAATVLLFGLLPARRSAGRAGESLVDPGRRGTPGRREGRIRSALVAVETALAVVLAVGSGLLAHDLVRMAATDPGFRPEGVASMRVNLAPRYEREEWNGMWDRFLEGARALPGVTAAGVATQVPFTGDRVASLYRPEGVSGDDERGVFLITVALGGDYVEALGARLVEGRAFGPADDGSAPTALVNEAFVRRFWPSEDGVGKVIRPGAGGGSDDEPEYVVVGVLADVVSKAGQDASPTVFLPIAAEPSQDMEVIVRTAGDAALLGTALRDLARRLDPGLPVTRVQTVRSLARAELARPRFYTLLFAGFAGVAVLLAIVGVYGTTAYSARARTREIGIRMALGAGRGRVVRVVVGRSAVAIMVGVALGILGAALGSRALTGVLRLVDPRDLPAYLAVAVVMAGTGLLAAWIPAARAGRVDPATTLREEG